MSPLMLMNPGRTEGENKERQFNPWQKIVSPANDEIVTEPGYPAWIHKYLDLADLLMRRVQAKLERNALRRGRRHRDAA